ncbi:LGFP repeat-containing protein [Amycolatopsis taiwanensis]|uniref:LGFP repeat-containing protein n=1 Tax=Amycolatopsis taiwanensis TaxID=342230 RepID=UPI001FE0192D|nr:hypothetical protein [Amycolatopsis taiwanensis]
MSTPSRQGGHRITSTAPSTTTGAWALRGLVLAHYRDLGGPGGLLGFPTSDETWTADGEGSYNDFAGSGGASIYWSQASGAWSLHGEIRAKYLAVGGEPVLGFPTTDENGPPDSVGRYNQFSGAGGASIYWTAGTGAHEVQGAIRSRWAQLGWETGPGYPVTDEIGTPDGVGRYNHDQSWSSDLAFPRDVISREGTGFRAT